MSRYPLAPSPVPMWRPIKADPASFYPPELVERSKSYQRPLQRWGMVSSIIGFVYMLGFISLKVGPRLSEGTAPWPVELLLILGVFLAIDTVIGIPIAVLRFKHENRWGFNKRSAGGKILDDAKELFLSFVLLSIVLVGLIAFVRATDLWWVYAMALIAVLTTLLAFLAPTLVKLFNKLKPMEDAVLRDRLMALARGAGAEVSEIFVMDMSKRTSRDNAFFGGMGKSKRIVVGDNMLELGHDAVAVVVAHEIGHWRRHGMVKRTIGTTLLTPLFFGLVALIVRMDVLQRWAGVTSEAEPGALPLFLFAIGLVMGASRWASAWRSRWREREADLDSLELTGDLANYRTLWMQMPERNLPDLDPSFWARAKASHPPAFQRLAFADVWEQARAATR